MSTIEEAREQAREALAQWDAPGGNHSGQVIGFLASALRALLDATEPSTVAVKTEFRVLDAPKDCDYHEGFEEGVKFGRAGSGPRPITDEDEREALVMTRKLVHEVLEQSRTLPLDVQSAQVMLVLLDAGYSKGPRPITDEMVAAADFAIMPYWGERYPSGSLTTEIARAALEAAEGARR